MSPLFNSFLGWVEHPVSTYHPTLYWKQERKMSILSVPVPRQQPRMQSPQKKSRMHIDGHQISVTRTIRAFNLKKKCFTVLKSRCTSRVPDGRNAQWRCQRWGIIKLWQWIDGLSKYVFIVNSCRVSEISQLLWNGHVLEERRPDNSQRI